MLLFQPESLEVLKARFPKALEHTYTVEGMKNGEPCAADQRKHVFDFDDGTRLVVSHERLGTRLYLHCTGSMDRRSQICAESFDSVCYTKVCTLAGKTLKVLQTDREDRAIHLLLEPLI
jgi:hypothetical protein